MKKISTIFLLLAFILAIPTNAQSGWTKAKNDYFFKLDYSAYKSSDFRNNDGKSLKTSK